MSEFKYVIQARSDGEFCIRQVEGSLEDLMLVCCQSVNDRLDKLDVFDLNGRGPYLHTRILIGYDAGKPREGYNSLNEFASNAVGHPVYGDVVIVVGDDGNGDFIYFKPAEVMEVFKEVKHRWEECQEEKTEEKP